MKLQLNYLLSVLSLVLFVLAPKEINMPLIIICFTIFGIGAIDILKHEWKFGFTLSYNFLFLISFFFVSYAFALFVVSSDEMYDAFSKITLQAFKYIDFSYITQATALCTIAINCYFIGYKKYCIYDGRIKEHGNTITTTGSLRRKANFWASFFWILTVANIFITLRFSSNSTNLSDRAFIYEFYKCALAVALVANGVNNSITGLKNSMLAFIKNNTVILLEALSIVLFLLYIGDRGNAVAISLMLICTCAIYYYRFSVVQFLAIAAIGAVLLFAIRQTRSSDSSLRGSNVQAFTNEASQSIEGQNPLFIFADLIGASQELCIGYAIKEEKGLQYPEQLVLLPFYPFPFLPSIGSQLLFDKPLSEVTGVQIFNDYLESNIGFSSTYGKHCVSDIYMKWNIVGVIVFFYIFGMIMGRLYRSRNTHFLSAALYLAIISTALYLPRSSVLDIIRLVAFTFLICYLCGYKNYSFKKSNFKIIKTQ